MGSSPSRMSSGAPAPRVEVECLKAYSAPLEGRRGLLRLDFNENTIGPSPRVLEALRAIAADQIAVYPEYDGLREAVVANLSNRDQGRPGLTQPLSPSQIGLFNGVDAAIHAIFHAYGDRGARLLTTSPTFGYYTPCAQMQGMEILAIPYEGSDFCFPLEVIRKRVLEQKPRLLLLCNPNNPTGTRLAPEQIQQLAIAAPETLVVVDELYEAFTGDSVMPLADFTATPNLLVLRSLAKTAGLAGLRMGFAIGSADVIDRVSRVTGPYDINSFAVTAAFVALDDQAYVDAYVADVLKARDWLRSRLDDSGVRYHLDGGNYLLIWPQQQPAEVEAALRKRGILVRLMTGKPLIDGSLRVSIGTTRQMQQFWQAFATVESLAA
ncbi:histidinol-phosphate transaminase [Prochlorococcus sp. MIT 1303]|uniref:pyridoxal phosphate-dependent aminotransferase n=1 Tax=Prochlorococcus sp. MIT 1303 TaxID=1723647 RepID=UPI0007B365D4|nr:histidinol-phosphate transaminase [Prochlorococcus sp. MIT 1303]KZR62134.1 Histidinol-phosphate aminotransferase [Prochlorococcus sp. MIT 1303]